MASTNILFTNVFSLLIFISLYNVLQICSYALSLFMVCILAILLRIGLNGAICTDLPVL